MSDNYVCQCDVCTGNLDNCAKCGKTFGASELTNGLCRDCKESTEPECWCDPEEDGVNPSCPTHGDTTGGG